MHNTSWGQPKRRPRTRFRVGCAVLVCLLLSRLPLFLNAANALARSSAGCMPVDLRFTLQRSLVSLDFTATLLNLTNEQAFELIEDGSLLWAFDLSSKQGERRKLIRVYAGSVADYLERRPSTGKLPAVREIIDQVFPDHGSTITAADISRQWGTDPDHVLNVWRAGHLRLFKGSKCRLGRNGSPLVDFGSVADFMAERQVL